MTNTPSKPFLEIDRLSIALGGSGTRVLRSVSLAVKPGEVHGLVGESGAGKSMIGKAIVGVLPRAVKVIEGTIRLDGKDLGALPERERRQLIGTRTAMIPQDPMTALNPSRRILGQITDRLIRSLGWDGKKADERAREILEEVQIRDIDRVLKSYPHELSGGMRQRVLIGAAFAAEPKLIVADEPTTALDVTVQKQILKLIADLQQRHGTALLFVTHDMGVVAKICQTVSVLYAGKIMEQTDVRSLIETPSHAYSAALIAATPRYDRPDRSLQPVAASLTEMLLRDIVDTDRAWSSTKGAVHG